MELVCKRCGKIARISRTAKTSAKRPSCADVSCAGIGIRTDSGSGGRAGRTLCVRCAGAGWGGCHAGVVREQGGVYMASGSFGFRNCRMRPGSVRPGDARAETAFVSGQGFARDWGASGPVFVHLGLVSGCRGRGFAPGPCGPIPCGPGRCPCRACFCAGPGFCPGLGCIRTGLCTFGTGSCVSGPRFYAGAVRPDSVRPGGMPVQSLLLCRAGVCVSGRHAGCGPCGGNGAFYGFGKAQWAGGRFPACASGGNPVRSRADSVRPSTPFAWPPAKAPPSGRAPSREACAPARRPAPPCS